MLKRAGIVGAFFIWALAMVAPSVASAQAGPFGDWAAVVIAGDFHGAGGGPTEAFDNARRDVSKELQRLGFSRDNIVQFSVRPERYKDRPLKSDTLAIYRSLNDLSAKAKAGCWSTSPRTAHRRAWSSTNRSSPLGCWDRSSTPPARTARPW